jgi:hypothetical protein
LWLPGVLVSLLLDSHVISLPALGAGLKIVVVMLYGAFLLFASADIVLTIFFGVCFGLMLSTADYTAYYNTFYSEAPSSIFLFFVLLALAALVHRVTTLRIVLFLVAAALLGACKLQYTYLWLLSVGFLLWIVYRAGRLNVRTALAVSALGVAVGLPPIYNLWRVSTEFGLFHYNDYNRVYDGILTFSDDPRRLLRIVGADDVTCVGTIVFEPVGIRCAEQHPASYSRANTLRLLAAEPVVVPRMIGFAADSMQDLSLEYLGKYERGDPRVVTLPRTGPSSWVSAIRRDFYSQYPGPPWNLWSAVKYRLFPRGVALFAYLLSALVFFMFARDRRVGAPLRYAGVFSVLVCFSQMVVDVFGDGKEEMIKHLYLANIAFDVSLVLLAAGVLMLARNRAARVGSP